MAQFQSVSRHPHCHFATLIRFVTPWPARWQTPTPLCPSLSGAPYMHTHIHMPTLRAPSSFLQCLLSFNVKRLLCSYHIPSSGVLATPPLTHPRRATQMGSVASSYEGKSRNPVAEHTGVRTSLT